MIESENNLFYPFLEIYRSASNSIEFGYKTFYEFLLIIPVGIFRRNNFCYSQNKSPGRIPIEIVTEFVYNIPMKNKKSKTITRYLACVMVFSMAFLFVSCSEQVKEQPNAQTDKKAIDDNPLLSTFNTPFNVPPFDKIKEEHYLPAFKEGIKRHQEEIEAIVANSEAPSFANTLEALDNSGALYTKVSSVFGVLKSVMNNDRIEEISKELSPLRSKHRDDIRLNEKLFQRIKAVYDRKDGLNLQGEQAMLLEKYYKDFARNGADLSPEKKVRLREINKELSLLSLNFGQNILKENNRFELVIDKKEDLAGLPENAVKAAAETAKERKHEGKWVFTLQKPSMIPFLQFSDKRELREKIYKAYINKGDNGDELDNKSNIKKIVSLRLEKAKLLGYANHAEYVLEVNMAKKPVKVYDLLQKLWKPALAMAKKEALELQEQIDKEGGNFKLQSWDWWYYTEKLRKAKFDLDDETIRNYFKLDNVRDGAFYVANKLYGLKFVERKDIPKYLPEVQVFEVQEADGSHVGILYMDFHPRTSKSSGAWMNSFRKQVVIDGKHIAPVITNNGNFTKPAGEKPSLLSFDEVGTLFHEFGHGLHGLLSKCTYDRLSGTSVARDFVELPSQIMENWALEPEVLKVYAKHYKTGEVIPQELVDKLKKAGLFNKGFEQVEYLAASILDMNWHTLEDIKNMEKFDVNQFESDALKKIGLIPEIISRYRSTYFKHIFSGGYSSGYYSYVWAEVLDADAFEAFNETSLFDGKTAKAFRENILQKGGTVEPMTLYKQFRGAEPKIEALLKRNGLQ